jgi:hypothetical protein
MQELPKEFFKYNLGKGFLELVLKVSRMSENQKTTLVLLLAHKRNFGQLATYFPAKVDDLGDISQEVLNILGKFELEEESVA